jgi:hypothetical protein
MAGNSATGGANSPVSGNGLFNGDNSFLGQISYAPTNAPFQIGFTYVNAYKKSGAIFDGNGGTGTQVGTALGNFNTSNPVKLDAYGISGSFQFNPSLVVNAFGSYIKANDLGVNTRDIYTYGLGIALPDFGKKGNLLGFVAGAQPYQSGGGLSTPFHVEGFYKYQVNDRISVTPGVIWITNPTQTAGEKSAIIGTFRTTFTF